ncbi:hypothetical protein HK099_005152 [Clydaea vesicula]|uniref:ubiquitinyl hydrolase 1 n=1 Tax=Clydaea vesicula TaxID=447962 RepID=A0AAD5U6P7_9FUNG|nr:hypothetical protein HK099_005152 [Clydaea vesicula]
MPDVILSTEEKNVITAQLLSTTGSEDVNKITELLQKLNWDKVKAEKELLSLCSVPKDASTLKGCENAGNTCYIDAVLFAMLATNSNYDFLLTKKNPSPLIIKLRLLTNQLRSGVLLKKEFMEELRESFIKSGWQGGLHDSPRQRRLTDKIFKSFTTPYTKSQMDASEFLSFLSDILRIPFMVFYETFFHGGKEEVDDHKVLTQRTIEISIEETESNFQKILLNHFTNNYVNGIKRFVEIEQYNSQPFYSEFVGGGYQSLRKRGITLSSKSESVALDTPSFQKRNNSLNTTSSNIAIRTPSILKNDDNDSVNNSSIFHGSNAVIHAPDESSLFNCSPQSYSPVDQDRSFSSVDVLPSYDSFCKSSVVSPSNEKQENTNNISMFVDGWRSMFLLPYLTFQNETGDSFSPTELDDTSDIAKHVVPIIIKRYKFENGLSSKTEIKLDIPFELDITKFVLVDNLAADSEKNNIPSNVSINFILKLRSAVCHLGNSTQSGHYISYGQLENGTWLKHDDFKGVKVKTDDEVKVELGTNGYILFYELLKRQEIEITTTENDEEIAHGIMEEELRKYYNDSLSKKPKKDNCKMQ